MAAGWTPKDYTPFFLYQAENPQHSPREVRREYSRMRDIAVKRSKRLREGGFVAQADYLLEIFQPLSAIGKDITQVEKRLAKGKSLMDTEKAYSLSGIRQLQRLIQSETGELVPIGKVLEFDEYMKSWRLSAFKMLVKSDTASEMYGEEYQDIGGSFSDFYTLFQNQ